MNDLIQNNLPPKLINFDGYWLDIGRPEDYQIAVEKFESERSKFLKK